MTQNNEESQGNNESNTNIVKRSNSGTELASGGSRDLLSLTDTILNATIIERKSSQLIIDESWMEDLWAWADKWVIDEWDVPRNREELLEITSLSLSSPFDDISELPESIGNLVNLTSLSLGSNSLYELSKSIGNLVNLTSLDLGSNELSELPYWLDQDKISVDF